MSGVAGELFDGRLTVARVYDRLLRALLLEAQSFDAEDAGGES
ncbi:hypothetical protein [Actinomadura roseirufa]|nr:hypothetical protein [Actinomadura roseirufa]